MEIKKITLEFDLGQVCNDVLAKCYQVSLNLQDDAQKDIRANIESPDSTESKSIINRSITEAIGNLKIACQRYLTTGRTDDNNNLERLVKGTRKYTYTENTDGEGKSDGTWTLTETTTIDGNTEEKTSTVQEQGEDHEEIIYEKAVLSLEIPNFNIAVTDGLKSHMHRYMVDYVMSQFLSDQYADKASQYAESVGADYDNVRSDLMSRDSYIHRRPSWT